MNTSILPPGRTVSPNTPAGLDARTTFDPDVFPDRQQARRPAHLRMGARYRLGCRFAMSVALTALTGACLGAELSSRAYPPLLAAGAAGDSFTPLVGDDGRYVVFVSAAENLAANDGNQLLDVFLRDRETRATRLLSAHTADSPPGRGHAGAIAISADANWIAYEVTQLSLLPGRILTLPPLTGDP